MLKVFSSMLIVLFSIALASAQTTVSGMITGFHGQPIPLANVFLSQPNEEQSMKSGEASKTGEFKIIIDSKGVWLLRFSGVYHQDYTVAVYVDKPKAIYLNVKLATYKYGKEFSEVKVLGNFNKWYPPAAIPMDKQVDGTYTAEINANVNPILYQLVGVMQGNVAGTEADGFAYNEYNGYNAVLKANRGKVRIVFDPKKLISSDEPAGFTFSGADSIESRFAQAYDEMQRWNAAYTDSLISSVSRRRLGTKATGFDCASVLSTIEKQLENEPNDVVRQELHLIYFLFAMKGGMVDTSNSRVVLREIPPEATVWSLAPGVISYAFDYSRYDKTQRAQFVQQVLDENPSVLTKSFLLSNEFMKKLYGGEKEQAMRYYDIAVNQYGNTPGGEEVSHYHNVSATDPGKPAPVFSVTSMQKSPKTYTDRSFKGKYYLMYFWATWSKPSVDEIGNLRKAYKEFNGKRFVILGLSLDSSRQVIEKFRQSNGMMPWPNALIGEGFESKICKDYEVYSLPKPVLVDPHGKIVAVGLDLRGDRLMKTLAKYLRK